MESLQAFRQKHPQYDDMDDTALSDAIHSKFYSDMPKDEFVAKLQGVDTTKGAPTAIRAAVGAAVKDEDKLATLQQFYPDVEQLPDGNFSFTNPETGKKQLFNEANSKILGVKIPTPGDIAENLPLVAEMGGGIIGGMMGAPGGPAGIYTGYGVGAASGREAYGNAAKEMMLTKDTRSQGEKASDIVTTTALNAFIPAGVDKGLAKAKQMFSNGARRMMRGKIDPTAQEVVEAADRLGISLPAGVVGNKTTQSLERGLLMTPGGADTIASTYNAAEKGLAGKADELAKQIAGGRPLTKEGTGAAMQKGVEKRKMSIEDAQERLYTDRVYKLIPANLPVQLTTVNTLAGEITKDAARAPSSFKAAQRAIKRVQGLLDDGQQGLAFQGLRNVRTEIGEELSDPNLTASESGYLKRLYGAITEDMHAAARGISGDAERTLKMADRYTRFNKTQNMPEINSLMSRDAEYAFSSAMSAAQDGGTRLRTLKRNLPKETWDQVSGTVFENLGRAGAGSQGATEIGEQGAEWSLEKFLTSWNKLSPEARETLFSGTGREALVQPLNDLLKVSSRMKEAMKGRNFSNTAPNLAGWHTVTGLIAPLGGAVGGYDAGGFGGAAGAAVTTLLAPRYAAKLMQKPEFVKWLAGSAQASLNPKWMRNHMSRLVAIGNTDEESRMLIGEYIKALGPQQDQQ